MLIKIKRQDDAVSKPYWQTFECEAAPDMTVSALLDKLNYSDDLFDTEGNPARRIRWECSCTQKMCGACVMVINGTPRLACAAFIRDIKNETLVLEPLSKFPVVSDLIVDRGIIEENLRRAEAYLGSYEQQSGRDFPQLYSAAKCLKCGLCLEVCPNYNSGESFFGALFANDMYLLFRQTADRSGELLGEYNKHFAAGCSKALSCVDVCPIGIDTLASMSEMNRRRRKQRK